MTAREKLKLEHPDMVNPAFPGGCDCCPQDLGYLPAAEDCIYDKDSTPIADDERCTRCWDREIPELPNPFTPRILDSGNRRQFETGAVRDIQEGKGRCDLLPLDVVALYIEGDPDQTDFVLWHINLFQEHGQEHYLFGALNEFAKKKREWRDQFTMMLEVAKHFEEGAKKYGDNNWRKGIPVRCYIDSGVRHYLKFLRGDKDEPHDRAFCWNMMCAIWTCKHKPELNEYAVKEDSDGTNQ